MTEDLGVRVGGEHGQTPAQAVKLSNVMGKSLSARGER